MAPLPGRRRKQGYTFYITALLISLLACYSIIRSFSHDLRHEGESLAPRSLEARDLQCRLVHSYPDKCAFVKANCPDEEAGLVSYLQFYYCSATAARPFAFILLVVWISLLFSTIGIAASDFLCINLSTIATILGMSESLTGVTFLAFGNGSPDVFSTFAAMSSHSGSLAIGELIGAAGFITAVVAGSMAIVKPFHVARKSFIRDVGFFAVAASFSLVFLSDGKLRWWECVVMIGFYLFYVGFVVAWHWWMGRRRQQRLKEQVARLQHHIPNTQELEAPDLGEDDEESRPASERSGLMRNASGESIATIRAPGTPAWKVEDLGEDEDTRDHYLAEIQSNMRVSRPTRERRNTITPIRPSLIGALEFRAVLSSLEKKGSTPAIGLRRYSEDVTQFLSAQSQPDLSTTGLSPERARSPSAVGRGRAVSANDAPGLQISHDLLGSSPLSNVISAGSQTPTNEQPPSAEFLRTLNVPGHGNILSPQLMLSPSEAEADPMDIAGARLDRGHLAPPSWTYPRRSDDGSDSPSDLSPGASPRMNSSSQIPVLRTPHPEGKKSPLHTSFVPYTDSPRSLTPSSSRAPSIRLPEPTMSPESLPGAIVLADEADCEEMRRFDWWPYKYLPPPQIIVSTLFPTLYGWRSKSITDKLLGIVTAPTVFLLTITLPVVEANGDDDLPNPDPHLLTPSAPTRSNTGLTADTPNMKPRNLEHGPPHPHGTGLSRQSSSYQKLATDEMDKLSGPKEWNRWLVCLQLLLAPLFTVSIVWANVYEDHEIKPFMLMVLESLAFSLVGLLLLLATTSSDHQPKYRPLLCFLGFAVAIAWISTIANEVVGVLKAFGVILNISDAILGLTIFAVGNSLGDLVADITVAKLGYPVMALSACFGGPMLNILLGIGISGLYMTVRGEKHHHKKHPHDRIKFKPYEIHVSTTLMISGISLLVTLVGVLIFVPLNGWRMDRKIGWGLIALWTLSTIGNVIVEILGYGGDQ